MSWDEVVRKQVKNDYCTRLYSSVERLAKAHRIPQDTLWKWIREDHWREARHLVDKNE